MFDFGSLDRSAQRAAFAHMGAASKMSAAKKGRGKAARKMATSKKPSDLKAAQDARIRGATKQRMQAEIAKTKSMQAMWANRPSK